MPAAVSQARPGHLLSNREVFVSSNALPAVQTLAVLMQLTSAAFDDSASAKGWCTDCRLHDREQVFNHAPQSCLTGAFAPNGEFRG